MKEIKTVDIIGVIKILWKKKKSIISWGVIAMIIGIVVALSIPNQYLTTIKFAPEENNRAISGVMTQFATMMGSQINSGNGGINKDIYPQIIKSTPFALEFANLPVMHEGEVITFWQYQLKEQKKPWWNTILAVPSEVIKFVKSLFTSNNENVELHFEESLELQTLFVEKFRNTISITIDKKTNIVTIDIVTQSPKISTIIADFLIVKLQKYMTEYKTSQTKMTLESNSVMMEEAKNKFYTLDSIYTKTLDSNQNLISKHSISKIERLRVERDIANSIYQEFASQVALNKIKLNEEVSVITVIEPPIEPIFKYSPSRALIVIVYIFLACIIKCAIVVYKELQK